MNKKGFTLIELLATIGILVIMSLIIGANIISILKATEKEEEDFNKVQIEKAACVYVDSSLNKTSCKQSTGNCTITVQNIIESGLLDDSYLDEKNNTISIKWQEGEKICTYNN